MFKATPRGKRGIGRPKARWQVAILKDIGTLKIGRWWVVAQNRQKGCSADDDVKYLAGLFCYVVQFINIVCIGTPLIIIV